MEAFYIVILFFAGLGILLYGMTLFSRALESVLGFRFSKYFTKAAKNPISSYFLGSGVLFLTQKTTLVCSMVMGFVSVGTISLRQSISFVLGISFGSALSMILMMFQGLNLTAILTILCFVGAILTLFCQKPKAQTIAQVLIGFGMLFLGVELVGNYAGQLFAIPAVFNTLESISSVWFIMFFALAVSFLTTSSFASLTIIATLVGTSVAAGPVGITTASFGMLISAFGTAIADFVYSIPGQTTEAKRVAAMHLLFRLFSFLICVPFLFTGVMDWLYLALGGNAVMALIILHMVQMFVPSLILLPFGKPLSFLVTKLVPERKNKNNVYADFVLPDSAIQTVGTGYPLLLRNIQRLLIMDIEIFEQLVERMVKKEDIRGLLGRIKALEKMVKLTSNTAIRISINARQNELPKINVLLNILGDLAYILERFNYLYQYGGDAIKSKRKLGEAEGNKISELTKEFEYTFYAVSDIIKELMEGEIDSKTLKIVLDKTKENFALFQGAKKKVYLSKKNKKYPEDDIMFKVLLTFEDINTDLANISIKFGVLAD